MHAILTLTLFRRSRSSIVSCIFLVIAGVINAQNGGRFNNWYFGANAGVSFSTGVPVALTNGALVTTEGCATISDANGNLLFYTDGVTVWNRNHVAMTNGTGLHGNASSTQSAIIVQKPGSTDLYYIFTAASDVGVNGIKYSEVNMSLSAGLGAVTANKNILLRTPSCEKLTAVRHCNNTDVWIVSHDWNSNSFRTWLVTAAGVNTTPVVSSTGIFVSGVSQSAYGQLKSNIDGNKLVASYYGLSSGGVNRLEVYDFNNTSGVVSNALTLASDIGLYGAEFAPNGRIVYGATNQGLLLQYNLCVGSNAAVVASRYLVANVGPPTGSLQLGPDNKIYLARNQSALSVINNPNTVGAGCGFSNGSISLAGRISAMGLPNIPSFYLRNEIQPFAALVSCLDASFTTPSVSATTSSCASATSAIQSVEWNFGDPASGASNTSTALNPTHTFSATGTYSVRLVLNLGCYNDTLIQTVNASGFTVNTSTTPASCGASNGTATATPVAAGSYTYLWSNGQQTATATGLAAGTYSCVVTAASGCASTVNVTVTAGGSLTLNVNATNAACFGGNGSATASALGGASPYTYSWSNGVNGATATLAAGSYTVTVSDAVGCVSSQTATITQPTFLTAAVTANSPLCSGSTGSASVTVSGGTAPYSYAWSNGSALSSINGLAAGNYNVTVTDSRGCTSTSSGTISIPSALNATLSTSNPLCFGGSNGSASVSVNGGTSPYTYSWSTGAVGTSVTNQPAGAVSVTITDANGCNITRNGSLTAPAQVQAAVSVSPPACGQSNGTATASASGGSAPYTYVWSTGTFSNQLTGIAAGNYYLTVTDNFGCIDTENFSITASSAPSLTLTVTQQVSCNSGANGAIQSNVSGGTAPLTYAWNNGAVSPNASALSAGNYSLTVTDALGCTASANTSITQPTALLVSATVVNATCGGSDGSITAQVSGGTAPYTYSWNTNPAQVSATANGLQSGNYMLTITDANGCTATLNENVQSTGSISASTAVLNHVSCNGDSNGGAQVSVNGGTAPFSYQWSNGASSATAQNLNAGNYSVTVEDANGCAASANITINQALDLVVSGTVANATCGGSDGSIVAQVSGGTAPYSYSWNTNPAQVSATAIGLQSGNYLLTVTDANGCTATLNENVQSSGSISASAAVLNHVSCFGGNNGTAQVTVNGGTAPFTYQWSNGASSATAQNLNAGNYSVTVVDANGCAASANISITEPVVFQISLSSSNITCNGLNNGTASAVANGGTTPFAFAWSNGETATSISGLQAGIISIIATDAAGCIAKDSITISEPTALQVLETSTQITCNGASDGSIDLTISGAQAPYSVTWNDGGNQLQRNGLNAAQYSYTVSDAAGCEQSGAIVITEPNLLSVSGIVANLRCYGSNDGSIELQINGGTQPYSILWNSGQTASTIANLDNGTYSATIDDASGCSATYSATIIEPEIISFTSEVTPSSCITSDGSISITAAGGAAPYEYSINGLSYQSSSLFNNLTAGNHSISIRDAAGCELEEIVVVPSPANLSLTVVQTSDVTCPGAYDGTAEVQINGGTAPFMISWSSEEATLTASMLSAGTHYVTVTDGAGCDFTTTFEIGAPQPMQATATITDVRCFGDNDGAIALSLAGGTGTIEIVWESGSTAAQLNALTAGAYALELTDDNGCIVRDTFAVNQPLQALAVAADLIVPACGIDGGTIALDVIGGTAPYSYSWAHDANLNGPLAGNLSAGIYSVTIEDANQCSLIDFYTLVSPTPLTAQLDSIQNVRCYGGNDGEVFVTVNGGTAPYLYNWGDGDQAELTSLSAGTYTMEISDAGGCEQTLNFTINQPNALMVNLTAEDATCFGVSDGRVLAEVQGGSLPYAFDWSNGVLAVANENLAAGSYQLQLSDSNGCIAEASAVVNQPDALLVELLSVNPGCNNNISGSVTATVSGGVGEYSFLWNTGSTASEISGLSSGTYEIQVSDANACSALAEVTLVSGAAFSVFIEGDTSICKGEQTVLTATTNLPHSGYNISWGHGVNVEEVQVSPVEDEVFTVVFTDSLGCSESASVNVRVNPIPDIAIASSLTAGCAPLCTKFDAPAGAETYNWSFTNGSSAEGMAPTVCFESAGIFGVSLSISDSNGCSAQMTWNETIEVFAVPVAAFTANPTDVSLDNPIVNFSSQSSGANSYTYFFGDPANNYVMSPSAQHAYSDTGLFEVTLLVTNEHGCKDDAVRTIHVGGFTAFYIPNAFSPDGDGTNDVFMPKASGLPSEGYEMQIFDRWGNLLFVSTSWDKGWDGTYMGKEVQSGQYVCKVKYFDNKGMSNDQIGSVLLTE